MALFAKHKVQKCLTHPRLSIIYFNKRILIPNTLNRSACSSIQQKHLIYLPNPEKGTNKTVCCVNGRYTSVKECDANLSDVHSQQTERKHCGREKK